MTDKQYLLQGANNHYYNPNVFGFQSATGYSTHYGAQQLPLGHYHYSSSQYGGMPSRERYVIN